MKHTLFVGLVLMNFPLNAAYNCNCQDLTRDSAAHNTLDFNAAEAVCKGFNHVVKLEEKAKGEGTCTINGKPYKCKYEFGKIHPTSCAVAPVTTTAVPAA